MILVNLKEKYDYTKLFLMACNVEELISTHLFHGQIMYTE